jgi:hypothetical protein
VPAICLLFGSPASPAVAQLLRPADPGTTPGWVFTPSISFAAAWDDNVALSGHRAPTASDSVLQLTPSGELQYRGRYHWLAFAYTGSIARYQDLTELNSYDQQFRLDTRHLLSKRVTLELHNGLALVPTTDAVQVSGVPFLRTGSRLSDGRAKVTVAVGPKTSVHGSYSLQWVSFDRDNEYARYLMGGTAHGLSAAVEHALRKRLTVGATYTFRRASVSNGGGRFDISEAAATVNLQPTERLSLAGAFGFSHLAGGPRAVSPATDANSQASEGPSRPTVSRTGLSWHLSAVQQLHRMTVTASYSRSFVPSFGLGGTIQNEELSAGVRMPVARNRLYWQAGLSWRQNDPITAGEQSLRSLWLQTSVGYGVLRWLRVEANYWRSQQDSHLPGGRVDRNRVGVQMIAASPLRVH